jgi:hypothetical protein
VALLGYCGKAGRFVAGSLQPGCRTSLKATCSRGPGSYTSSCGSSRPMRWRMSSRGSKALTRRPAMSSRRPSGRRREACRARACSNTWTEGSRFSWASSAAYRAEPGSRALAGSFNVLRTSMCCLAIGPWRVVGVATSLPRSTARLTASLYCGRSAAGLPFPWPSAWPWPATACARCACWLSAWLPLRPPRVGCLHCLHCTPRARGVGTRAPTGTRSRGPHGAHGHQRWADFSRKGDSERYGH